MDERVAGEAATQPGYVAEARIRYIVKKLGHGLTGRSSTSYCPPCRAVASAKADAHLVRWLSGRKQRFAKAPYLSKGTEGSNPSLTVVCFDFVDISFSER